MRVAFGRAARSRRALPAPAAAVFGGERILGSDIGVDRTGRLVECVATDRGLYALRPERLTAFRYSAWIDLTCTSTTIAFSIAGPSFFFFDFREGEDGQLPMTVQKHAARWMTPEARRRVHLLCRARVVRPGRVPAQLGTLSVRGDDPAFHGDDGTVLWMRWADVACYRYTMDGFLLVLEDHRQVEVTVPVGELELWTPVLSAHLDGASYSRTL